jgi:hypothetical protein
MLLSFLKEELAFAAFLSSFASLLLWQPEVE